MFDELDGKGYRYGYHINNLFSFLERDDTLHTHVELTPSSTLIYPGCGYDEEFLQHEEIKTYKKIICIDMLPKVPHYKPDQAGWEFTKTPEVFFSKLKQEYGQYEVISETELFFPQFNLTYFHSTDVAQVQLPEGDMLIRGFWHKHLIPQMKQRHLLLSCGTVHTHGARGQDVCLCLGDCEWESISSSEEEEEETDEL
jgi:hypothetical protein